MSIFVINMASMIGIGVAVDYSLFVLARYRQEIRRGADPDRARATAMATSGRAVAFSGLTVITSLAGLWLIDNQIIRSMALGAILVVAVSVLRLRHAAPRASSACWAPRPRPGRLARRAGGAAARAPRAWTGGPGGPRASWAIRCAGRWSRRGRPRSCSASPPSALRTDTGALRQLAPGTTRRAWGWSARAPRWAPGRWPRPPCSSGRGGARTRAAARTAACAQRIAADPEVASVSACAPGATARRCCCPSSPRHDGGAPSPPRTWWAACAPRSRPWRRGASCSSAGTSAAQRDQDRLISGSLSQVLLVVPFLRS